MEKKNEKLEMGGRISLEAGRVDAMLAALVGILHAQRDNPEVLPAVLRTLTDAYPRKGPRSENQEFVDGFVEAADHILGALQRV
jgi:lipopolysaccharide biosynthesis regulator YciM